MKTKAEIKFENNVLPQSVIEQLPLFYRFLRRMPSEVVPDIPQLNWKISTSKIHHSKGYHLSANYKPNSKYVFSHHFK
jgi:hypothetical protein